MRILARSACMILLLSAAAPAAAQIAGRHDYGPTPPKSPFLGDSRGHDAPVGRRVDKAMDQVRHAREAGLISRREARQLRREARAIERLAHVYARDGLSDSERRELDTRTNALSGRASGGR